MAEVAEKKQGQGASSRTRSIAFVALTIAITAVSAWVVVPLGPIPFTLQMFAITFAIAVLTPKEAMCSILGYLALGAIGVPVFSGMRGGFGVLAGPTGGFLWGYIFGVAAAVGFLWLARRAQGVRPLTEPGKGDVEASAKSSNKVVDFLRNFGLELVAGIIFTAIAYVCGWLQYQFVAGVGPMQAFMVCCAPFILLDLCKIIAAVLVAGVVRKAVGR